MNKLHEALKNEELMLEVGRKATEEQLNEIEIAGVKLKTGKTLECDTPQCKEYVRLAQQSTVEERFNEYFYEGDRNSVMCKKHKAFATPIEIIRFANSEIQLAEQKAMEEERTRIIEIIEKHKENIKEPCVCVPGEETCYVCSSEYQDEDLQDIINQITKE